MARTLLAFLLLFAGCSFDLGTLRGRDAGPNDAGNDSGEPADARTMGPDGCVPTPVALSGGFSFSFHSIRSVTASGGSIAITDDVRAASGSIALGPGVTATGSFAACAMPSSSSCDRLNSISASGSTITLTSSGAMGNPTITGTITLVGATAVGGVTAMAAFGSDPGYFERASTSGDTITFYDGARNSGTITLTRTACP